MNAREMQVEFERIVILMNPEFEMKDKLSSDTIFAFLNKAQLRFVKLNSVVEDSIQDNTRIQKRNTDALKSLIVNKRLINYSEFGSGIDTDTIKIVYKSQGTYVTKYMVVGNSIVYDANHQIEFISDIDSYSTTYKLPDNYLLYIRSNSLTTTNYRKSIETTTSIPVPGTIPPASVLSVSYESIPNKMIKEDDIDKIVTTNFNKPIIRNPRVTLNVRSDDNTALTLITDSYTKVWAIDLRYYRKPLPFNVIGVDGTEILDTCELPISTHQEIVELAVEMFITEAKYRLNTKQPKESE